MVDLGNDWNGVLADEFEKEYYQNMRKVLAAEYRSRVIYPHMNDIFNSFRLTPFNGVKAVILGQDPYHGPGQAHGLCFSVKKPTPKPPSLVNIFKELENDLNITSPDHGDLTAWAEEGVLLLNTVLTVREGQANSHAGIGWQTFTDNVIKLLNERNGTIVFILWGKNAKAKEEFITNPKHKRLTAAHPSPLSAYNGFLGCKHFSSCNTLLELNGVSPINWRIG
ncbi:MAG: uracil-DNA glycosylase [Defluviitaleaceae bacterium]|nr:uracil-DNA glycosylase [Defluviitaleaceae bacterium]MCL2837428.1 uracil-DNA glycosylase [Defluviitaleaceae bacterium]